MTYRRTAEWNKYTSFMYERINVEDSGNRITITISKALTAHTSFMGHVGDGILTLAGIFLAFGGFFVLFSYPFIGAAMFVPGVGIFWLIFNRIGPTKTAVITFDGDQISFREDESPRKEPRQIQRSIWDGAIIDVRQRHITVNGAPRTVEWIYLVVRYGGVTSDIAVMRSKEIAQQAVLLINEAARQDLKDYNEAAETPAQGKAVSLQDVNIKNDDL